MRVRIAVHRFRPDIGGTELMAEMMATAMAEKGHDVEVVTLRTGPTPYDERLEVSSAPRAGTGPASYRVRRLDHLGRRLRIPVGYWRLLGEATDVLHVFGNRIWCSDWFLPIAGRVPAPKVLTGQNFYQLYMHPSPANAFYFRTYFPRMASKVDCYVVQTIQEGEQLREFGYRGRIVRIPHTVDTDEVPLGGEGGARFRADHGLEGDLLLLTSGGYAPNKRMDRVIEGVARARSRWKLVVTGKDWPGHAGDLASCRALAGKLGVRVVFLGDGAPVDRAEVIRAFYACDAYAQGSSYEGYGGAVQEAMTVERPFVAFDTGAIPEFVAAGAGFGVTTVDGLAEALDRLAASENLRRGMGQAGRRDVLLHRSREVTMRQYDALFREFDPGTPRAAH